MKAKTYTKFKRVDVHLIVDQIDELKILADETGTTFAGHVRIAVADYLKKIKKEKIKNAKI